MMAKAEAPVPPLQRPPLLPPTQRSLPSSARGQVAERLDSLGPFGGVWGMCFKKETSTRYIINSK